MYIRSPAEDTSWTTYTNPFARDQWIAFAVFGLVNAALVRLLYVVGNEFLPGRYDEGGADYSTLDAIFLYIMVTVQQGIEHLHVTEGIF